MKGCSHCPKLYGEQPVVRGYGNKAAEIAVVGERPGMQECRMGRPFVGPAGQMLNRVLEEIGSDSVPLFRTNIVRCYAPGNKPPRASESQACAAKLAGELSKLKQLKIVIALGAVPAKTLLRTSKGVSWMRGRIMEFPGFPYKFGATYHPAAVLRNPELYVDLKEDLEKYYRFVQDGILGRDKVKCEYFVAGTEAAAVEVLRYLLGRKALKEEPLDA